MDKLKNRSQKCKTLNEAVMLQNDHPNYVAD